MDLEKLLNKEKLCIMDEPSACIAKCPIHVDAKTMLQEVCKGNFDKAYKILAKKMPFPKVISRICDHVCENVCLRKDIGGSVSISEIEKAIIKYGTSKSVKSFPIPKNNNTIAIIGGGISGISAAESLDKKGYNVTIYEKQERLGGRLWNFPKSILPDEIIEEEMNSILKSQIKVKFNTELKKKDIEALLNEYDAVYIGVGKKIYEDVNMDTFQTDNEKIFEGGTAVNNNDSVIFSISTGRRAAISIDRYVQKKSLTAVRENEGSYITPLKVNIKDVASVNRINASNGELSKQEAIDEASRCINCECSQCSKVCTHLRDFETLPKNYIRKIKHNEEIIMGDHYANKMINSCTMCGLCTEVCPSKLDMRDIILETRKSMVKRGKMPISAHDFAIKDMEFSNSDKFLLCSHEKGFNKSKYLFFPGCQLSASSPEYVEETYNYLTDKVEDGVGIFLACCGAPAEWSGREELFEKTINNIKEKWLSMDKPTLILACSSCYNTFERYAPEINIMSLWTFMDEHGLPKDTKPKEKRIFSIHDACSTRYNEKLQNSVRNILAKLGCEIEELKFSKEKTTCCGYGGLVYYANKEEADKIIEERIRESDKDYLVYCSMCRDLFASKDKSTVHLLDIIFGNNMDELSKKKGPRLWERRINRAITRKKIEKILGEKVENNKQSNYNITLSNEIKDVMEERLILLQDIEQVIENAETTGEKFMNPENSHYLARKRIDNVTYWVEYERNDKSYMIYNTYCHRMEVVEE